MKSEEANVGAVSKSGKRQVKPVDPDPHGEKLLQVHLYKSFSNCVFVYIYFFAVVNVVACIRILPHRYSNLFDIRLKIR